MLSVCRLCAVRCQYVGSVQYVVSFLFVSICYFLFTRLTFCNFVFMFVVCLVFLFPILCILFFCVFCVLFLLLYIALSFQYLYKSTDCCHRVETQLQSINIISYHIISHQLSYRIVSYHIIYCTFTRYAGFSMTYKVDKKLCNNRCVGNTMAGDYLTFEVFHAQLGYIHQPGCYQHKDFSMVLCITL